MSGTRVRPSDGTRVRSSSTVLAALAASLVRRSIARIATPGAHRLAAGFVLALGVGSTGAALGSSVEIEIAKDSKPPQETKQETRPAQASEPTGRGSESLPPAHTARAREALARGLAYLARRQAELRDGSFPSDGAEFRVPVPVTALAALAFMAGGSQPDRGPHGRAIAAAVDYLCSQSELTPGSEIFGYIASDGDALSRMHGHGFATLALTQAYSMSPRSPRGERLARVITAAIERIQSSQGLEGGWMYEPRRVADHENSVTVVLVAALRGAHNVGFEVERETIARAIDYVRRCQNENGSFRYGLAPKNPSTLALTAASLATLNAAGRYDTPEVERGMTHLWQELESDAAGAGHRVLYPHYERMYVAEALWHHRDPRLYERWMEREIEKLVTTQAADGSWDEPQFGACYATATNCLVLALPLGQLPFYQR